TLPRPGSAANQLLFFHRQPARCPLWWVLRRFIAWPRGDDSPHNQRRSRRGRRMAQDPSQEWVDVIDDAGRTVGQVLRKEMRGRCLPHRCVYLLVFNSRGELFIHLRTPTKDVYPSHWDVTCGGVLAAGESFAEGARREAAEELGVEVDPEELFLFRFADQRT